MSSVSMKFQASLAAWISVLVIQVVSESTSLYPLIDEAPSVSRSDPSKLGWDVQAANRVDEDNSGALETRAYDKHSVSNVARRTAKRNARFVRQGMNSGLDLLHSGIERSAEYNEALRQFGMKGVEAVPKTVAPVVSPFLEGVIQAGNAVVDGTLALASGVTKSAKGLNDGLMGGAESLLKKKGPLSYLWGSS
nr:PREDICTED: uncharacterized protein LOC109034179 [Bemisia tabaci]